MNCTCKSMVNHSEKVTIHAKRLRENLMNPAGESLTQSERNQLQLAMAALEEKRSLLGDEVVNLALESMQERLAQLDKEAHPPHEPQQRKLVTILFADVSGFT